MDDKTPKITIEQFLESKQEVVIHCRTEAQAIELCKTFHELGLKWSTGKSYLDYDCWDVYKENTCYTNDGCYCNIDYCEFNNVKIIPFETLNYKEVPKVNKYQEALDEIGDNLKFLGEGGVLESTNLDNLQELVDRATPMKVKIEKWDNSITLEDTRERCPKCNTILFTTEAPYCPNCGQKLDWGNK